MRASLGRSAACKLVVIVDCGAPRIDVHSCPADRIHLKDATLANLAQRFDAHPGRITQWKKQLLEHVADAFGGKDTAAPTVDVKALHAKIGELTLENDFLSTALGSAGLLSVRR